MYPQQARNAHVAGKVTIWFTLNQRGEVTQADAVAGNPLLKEAALQCVRSWKFDANITLPASARYQTEFVYDLGVQERNGNPKLTVSLTNFEHVEVSSELYTKPIE
jgi:TonB family protein